MRITTDDPRLTAYVLGELQDKEKAEIEAALQNSEELRRELDQIRQTASLLQEELSQEAAPHLTDSQRDDIQANLEGRRSFWSRPSGWGSLAGLAAAASVSIMIYLTLTSSQPFDHRSMTASMEPGGVQIPATTPSDPKPAVVAPSIPKERDNLSTVAIKPPGLDDGRQAAAQIKGQVLRPIDQVVEGLPAARPERLATEQEVATAGSPPPPASEAGRTDTRRRLSQVGKAISPHSGAGRKQEFSEVLVASSELRAKASLSSPDAGGFADFPAGVRNRQDFNTEAYDRIVDNPFFSVDQNPLSTFSIDVDTASYANLRRFLRQGTLPPKDSVRIEEMLNYFSYRYQEPSGSHPFAAGVEVASAPWNTDHRLVRIGLKGKEVADADRPASNLVFLLDVSGSMRPANKLPLLKKAFRLLTEKLRENDRVAIAVYAGASGMVLPSTSGDQKERILQALDRLQAGGSTNGASGIQLAYQTAISTFIPKGINRVILATDGDFNIGVTNQGDLIRLIEEKAKSGVFLSVLGFGSGNLKDSTMEKLADKGNGNYAYIDGLSEARKVLVEQMGSTLMTIAKDVKIQIEFNPAQVSAYRLIGYENRLLRSEDFNDDTKDAGEIGAGHTVTALYEIVPAGVPIPLPSVDPLKYQSRTDPAPRSSSPELLTLKLRYKQPQGQTSKLLEYAVKAGEDGYEKASQDFRFAAAVASFGMLLRESPHRGQATFEQVLELARGAVGTDRAGYRSEFVDLVRKAEWLQKNPDLNPER